MAKAACSKASCWCSIPRTSIVGRNVYVGHRTILKGYYKNELRIGDDVWIGQMCFFHSAGRLTIGAHVGIGPGVMIMTSNHGEHGRAMAPLHTPLVFAPVVVEDEVNIGVGAIVMPGVRIGRGAKVGAGAVVTHRRANRTPSSRARPRACCRCGQSRR